jgi:leader peptidase (prepilin peptidase) / N-methyltransferase
MHLVVAAWCAALAGVLGLAVPRLVRVLPEPAIDPDDPKTPYADLAAAPGLAVKAALFSALAGGTLGAVLGADWSLLFLLVLCPVGVALAYVDWRVRLLPTAIIRPTFAVVAVLLLAAALLEGEPRRLLWALVGLVVVRGFYWLLWRFTPGMGKGDVRLAGIVGLVLGYFGTPALLVGGYAGFLLGAVCWVPMRLLRLTTDRYFPFGPFMLVGVVVGVVWSTLSR